MTLAIEAARLCVDCDILTDDEVCPVCGRNQTVPLAAWMSPLDTAPIVVVDAADRARRYET